MGVSIKGGYPQIIHFRLGFSLTKTIQLWGYLHVSCTPQLTTVDGVLSLQPACFGAVHFNGKGKGETPADAGDGGEDGASQ